MARTHARTWWDDVDDVSGEPQWVLPARSDRRAGLAQRHPVPAEPYPAPGEPRPVPTKSRPVSAKSRPTPAKSRPTLRAIPGGRVEAAEVRRPPARAARQEPSRRRAPERERPVPSEWRGRGSRPARARHVADEPEGLEARLATLVGDRPDRIALWAPMLGFFLMAVAAASAHV